MITLPKEESSVNVTYELWQVFGDVAYFRSSSGTIEGALKDMEWRRKFRVCENSTFQIFKHTKTTKIERVE